jgi:two-component system LytT family response regulator
VIRRRTPDRMPAVVFLTAYDQFAIRAFEAQALDYLVKPVSEARFAATIKRLTHQLRAATPVPSRRSSPPDSPLRDETIVVTTSRGATVLRVSEIDWIEAADNYARLWIGARSYLLRESLQVLEQRVRPHGFVRAHRNALVRLSAVRELIWSGDALVALLEGGAKIRVSRRRRAGFATAVRGASHKP